jgi:Metallo-peptidase family M12/Secretion system C-terminal sorting domain
MEMMCRTFFILLSAITFSFELSAQNYFFAEKREGEISAISAGKRVIVPEKYKSVALDTYGMQSFLKTLTSQPGIAARGNASIIELPMPEGGRAKYSIWESPVMDPVLGAKFPGIKTYTGEGIDDPTATIKIDFTELGFHAMVLSDITGNIFIDPYRQLDLKNYIVYYKKDFKDKDPFTEYDLSGFSEPQKVRSGNRPMAGPCVGTQLRSYRLAIACTGEYARTAVGNNNPTIAQALSAIVTSISRVDGVYEKELSISLNLVANNNLVVFVNPATDPFTANNDGEALLDESQTVISANIGDANYDIGHTFSTGAGGVAQLGTVCGSSKARGVTGSPTPVGDPYDIDYVAHEMGHQFDAAHTFNATTGSCNGNRSASTAVEPGSGITIMGYAGICDFNDLGQNSIPYFHAISFDEISTFVTSGGGSTCGTITATGNIIPIVNAGSNYTIPRSTPFVLDGSATDGNGDVLTYSWEQVDAGPSSNWDTPTGNAPLFRSFEPVSSAARYFPKLADQVNNTTTIGEILPSYGRTMTFRLTARDNRAAGGGVCFDENSVIVNAASGPFVVTVPSAAGISWSGGSSQTVTWNVTNTNIAPVNCANVSIQLSTDGGLTFPITILASTPNDGTQIITVPNNVTTQGRIRVMAVGNVFYDMSNNNFTITVPQAGFDFTAPAEAAKVTCANPASTSAILGTVSVLGYNTPIALSATGNPPGTTVSFSAPTVVPGSPVQVILNNTDLLPFSNSYTITVTGVSGAVTKTQDIVYTIQTGTGPVITEQPQAQQVCKGASATFNVVASSPVAAYQWQFSNNGGQTFNNITGATLSSYTITNAEEVQNNYQFRVLLRGQCNITTSNPAELTVYALPAVTLAASLASITPGQNSLLTSTVTPGSSSSVVSTWLYNGDVISVTGNTFPITVTGLGSYQVTVIDDNSCTNGSDIITINAKPSSSLFIYPSPNDGRFTLSYYNAGGGNTRQSVTIYDSKGARVYVKVFTFSGTYELHDIDIRGRSKGVYFIVVGDANGKKIVDGKVLVN